MTCDLRRRDLQFRPARGTECSHKRSVRWKQFLPESALGIDFPKDNTRSGRGTPVAKDGGSVMNDLRFACRQLLKNPGFTAVAVLTLALGIGANLALFAMFNELLLRPKPVANPDEMWAIEPADSIGQPLFPNVCRPYYEAVRQHARVFKGTIGYGGIMPKLASKEEGTERI